MLVFISYPREFEETAIALDAELRSREIKTFLDKEDIRLTDVWKLKIESNIKEASVFIILYLPEAAKTARYFLREIQKIENECKVNLKKVITVIFPETTPKDLPPFFKTHQVLEAEATGYSADDRDGHWIDQIMEEVERLKEIERLAEIKKHEEEEKRRKELEKFEETEKRKLEEELVKKIRWRRWTARTALATAGMVILALFFNRWKEPTGESVCHSLIGNYALHQNYVFNEGVNARSVATNAAWKATNCEYNPRLNGYILRGEEETDFDIEAIINGKFEPIARAKYHYRSEVYINKDGVLLGRSFEAVLHPKDIHKLYMDKNGNRFNKPEEFFDKTINDVIELRNKKHRELKTTPCVPAHGETGGRVTMAFICSGYTRTMVKMS